MGTRYKRLGKVGTRYKRLGKAQHVRNIKCVLMKISSLTAEKNPYVAWACFRNGRNTNHHGIRLKASTA